MATAIWMRTDLTYRNHCTCWWSSTVPINVRTSVNTMAMCDPGYVCDWHLKVKLRTAQLPIHALGFESWIVCLIQLIIQMNCCSSSCSVEYNINTFRPRQDVRHFADVTFKCILLNGNVWIPITISLRFVPKGPTNNITAMVQIMA